MDNLYPGHCQQIARCLKFKGASSARERKTTAEYTSRCVSLMNKDRIQKGGGTENLMTEIHSITNGT